MCKEIANSFETLRIQIKPQVLVVMQDLTNVKMCKKMYKYLTKHANVKKKKVANIFGRIQICSGKSDQGQVQMGSCWDANSGKEGARRLMRPVKFQPQPMEQRYRHVQTTFHILQISRIFKMERFHGE